MCILCRGWVLLCYTDLADHRATIVDELGQHHGHVVVDSGGVVRPLSRVSHKRPKRKNRCTPHLQRHKHGSAFINLMHLAISSVRPPFINPELCHFQPSGGRVWPLKPKYLLARLIQKCSVLLAQWMRVVGHYGSVFSHHEMHWRLSVLCAPLSCFFVTITISHYFLWPLHWMFNPNLPLHRRNLPWGIGFTNWTKLQLRNENLGIMFVVETENIFAGARMHQIHHSSWFLILWCSFSDAAAHRCCFDVVCVAPIKIISWNISYYHIVIFP